MITLQPPLPILIQYSIFDNESVCRGDASGVIRGYTDEAIFCLDETNTPFTLFVNPEGGWDCSQDEYDRRVDVYPHPESTPEQYRIVEDLLSMNDHLI